ncbi:prestin-like isoform X1 [Diadema setosum]|uniref:prestin-like isoform X1 n=2 Tax=Diadema setosum TaxID=31175 RepID=UPI003B3A924F
MPGLSEHRPLHHRSNNLYVTMDDDFQDGDLGNTNNGDTVEENETRSKDGSTGSEPLSVVVDRPLFSTSSLQEKYGYQPVPSVGVLESIQTSMRGYRCNAHKLKKFFMYVFPVLVWLPKYDLRNNAIGDLMAGLIVGVVNIPQSIAFALLAVLPPVHGLYTAFFAPLAFFLMGSSRHTSLGTFGVVAILCGDAVERIIADMYPSTTVAPTTQSGFMTSPFDGMTSPGFNVSAPVEESCGPICQERIKLHAALCLLVGIIQTGLGVFRLGFVTVYLAQPLVRAFTTGAACHVITSQVPPLLGLNLPRYAGPLSLIYTWRDIFINLPDTNVATMLFAVIGLFILAPGKYLSERYKKQLKVPIPWELLVVIVGILVSYYVEVDVRYGVDIIGDVPIGFPEPAIPPASYFSLLIADAVAIGIVGFAVSVSLAKIFATKNDYEIDSNQELMGYGVSNIMGGFFSCFVSASALARVALLDGNGGKTQIAMMVSSTILMFVLLFIGPLFEPLPKSVLSIIIIYALRGMMAQFADLRTLYKTSKVDCSIWLVTWLAVFLLGVDLGLGVGVLYALLTVIVRSQLPRFSVEGHLPGSEYYRDSREYDAAKTQSGIHIFKMQATLYYANADQFKKALYRQIGINPVKAFAKLSRKGNDSTFEIHDLDTKLTKKDQYAVDSPLHTIIIDCSHFDFVDVNGARTLTALLRDFSRIGIATVFCSCADSVIRSVYKMSELDDVAEGKTVFYPSALDAVMAVTRKRERKDMVPTSEALEDDPISEDERL